jgi:hypothetical protein
MFFCEIQKGMYCLPQAGLIAQDLLQERLANVGYHQSKIIPGLLTHEMRKICFTLVVDNFAIKYTSTEDTHHLIDALKQDNTITIDWGITTYIKLTLKWDYKNQKVYAHMPGYIKGITLIQASNAKSKTELTASTCKTPIWNQSTICNQ